MSRDHTQLLTIAVLLVAVGIMAYGWGLDHERASDYRDLMGQYRDTVHAMEDRYNAAQDTIDALAYRRGGVKAEYTEFGDLLTK